MTTNTTPKPDARRWAALGASSTLAWIAVAAILAIHAWMLIRFSVNFPFQDDFTQLLAVPNWFDSRDSLKDKIAYVFELSVEHRIATLRMIALLQAKALGGIQFQWMLVYGIVVAACAALLVVTEASRWQRPWAALASALLLTSPALHMPQYWATAAVQHFGMVFYAFAALYCATRVGVAWTALGLVLAAAAACTAANGLLVFVAAALVLAYARRFGSATVWAIAAGTMFALYFHGYEPPAGKAAPLESLRDPSRFLLGWAAALGSVAGTRPLAIFVGSALFCGVGWVAWGVRKGTVSLPLLAWLLFAVLSAAAIAAGRLPWGDYEVLNSRYRVYSGMAVLVAVTSLLKVLDRRSAIVLLGLLVLLTSVWAVRGWRGDVLSVADLFAQQRLSMDRYAATGHGLYRHFPLDVVGNGLLTGSLQRNDFALSSASAPTVPIEARVPADAPAGATYRVQSIAAEFETVSVYGFAPATAGTIVVWMAREARNLRADLQIRRLYRHWESRDLAVFWGTLSTRGMAPGRYRIGFAGTLGDAGVTWTEHWVTVTQGDSTPPGL